jgi:hypothetical protein
MKQSSGESANIRYEEAVDKAVGYAKVYYKEVRYVLS